MITRAIILLCMTSRSQGAARGAQSAFLDASSYEEQDIPGGLDAAGCTALVKELLGVCTLPSSRDHLNHLAIGNVETRDLICELLLSAVKHVKWRYAIETDHVDSGRGRGWLLLLPELRTGIHVSVDPSLMS